MERQIEAEAAAEGSLGLRRLLEAGVAEEAEERREAKRRRRGLEDPDDTSTRATNRDWLRRVDHQMRRVGVSLSKFMPTRRPRALQRNEKRVFVPMRGPLSGREIERSRIEDGFTNEKWWELPIRMVDGVREYPCWHCCADQGNVGWPGLVFLFRGLGLRGSLTVDPLHRFHNDWRQAETDAGMVLLRFGWFRIGL